MYSLKLRCLQIYTHSTYEVHMEYASANRPYVFKLPTGDTFIIYVRYLEVYIKISGANLILVPMSSVEGKTMD